MEKRRITNKLKILLLFLILFTGFALNGISILYGSKHLDDLDFNEVIKNDKSIQSTYELEVGWLKYFDFSCPKISIIDVEHDGLFEIITGTQLYNYLEEYSSSMICLNGNNGDLKWEKKLKEPIGIGNGMVIKDLDFDGNNEIIIPHGEYLVCYNAKGNLLWKNYGGYSNGYLTIADINNDGFMNILTIDYNIIQVFDHKGNFLWSKHFPFNSLSKPNVADLDDDGEMEILLIFGGNKLVCLNKSGEIIWEKELSNVNSYYEITIADILPSIGMEILTGNIPLTCLNCNGEIVWSSIFNSRDVPIVCDMNNDGNLEIITRYGGDINCLDVNGELIRKITSIYGSDSSNTLIADLNGDGFCEFINCRGSFNPNSNMTINCYNYMGELLSNIELRSSYLSSLAIFDVDLNGVSEILLTAENNDYDENWESLIYCINIKGISESGIQPWSHTSGTNCNTGTSDIDGDFLDDTTEEFYNTDENNCDSDSDTIIDGIEILLGLDPKDNDLIIDQDYDMITNYDELYLFHTLYDNNDSDFDNLSDYQECFIYYTNPIDEDTDHDMLSDYDEIFIYFTDPLNNDCDNDLIYDGWEILYGFDPFLNDSYLDHDNDSLTAYQEFLAGSNPYLNDTDYDNLTDAEEFLIYGTNPDNENTDGDMMDDYWEVTYGTNPLLDDSLGDPDLDCLKNYEEFQLGTDPSNPDTDGDGYWDSIEIWEGTDPLNASSHPPHKSITTPNSPSITIGINFSAMLLTILVVNIVLLIFLNKKIKKKL